MKRFTITLACIFCSAAVLAEEQSVTVDGDLIRFDEVITADENHDGVKDRISCYQRGKLVLSIYDVNDDGTPDMWRTYDAETMKVEIKDTTGDGNPDTYYDYNKDGYRTGTRTAERSRMTSQDRPAAAPTTGSASGPLLRARKSKRYRTIWTDKGSGAKVDFAVFRAATEAGFYPIGDTALASPWRGARYGAPKSYAVLIGDGTLAVRPPVDYKLTWNSSGSPANRPFSSWQPIPPAGYRCLGDVGSGSKKSKPPRDAVRCIPQQCAERTSVRRKIWDDNGSNAHDDFSAWATGTPGVYIGQRSHGQPRREVYQLRESCLTTGV